MTTMGFFDSVATGAAAMAFRGEAEAGEEIDVVARDQFLREALGDFAIGAAVCRG
jgi:hypothetical protein